MIRRKFLIVGILVMISLAFLYSAVLADSYTGSLTITCTDALDFGPGLITLDRDNTGVGNENFEIKATDGNGNVLRDFFNTLTLGDYVFGDLIFTTAPQANPITVTFISLAGNDLPEVTVFSQQGNCSTLVSTCLPLTADAVVGDMPFQTQAYWAPGKVSPDLMIDPGTYWVLGEELQRKLLRNLAGMSISVGSGGRHAAELSAAVAGSAAAHRQRRVNTYPKPGRSKRIAPVCIHTPHDARFRDLANRLAFRCYKFHNCST